MFKQANQIHAASKFDLFINKTVVLVTNDNTQYVGKMIQYDLYGSVTLTDTKQQLITDDNNIEENIGTIIIRGADINIIGLLQ
ncbi:LSM_domain [Hexamita inflata]|uniref:Eukaryotic/archaea-type n=1 Tax=Hexamita inflata TaxID=28002 RepID=A0AA86TLP6_9EUKA|nr:LSM domain [Hexamita inflata]CAI9945603.1 LSM domain [Hexamita inflata]CAI9965114.1 LSM domain [Hexamita inflata]